MILNLQKNKSIKEVLHKLFHRFSEFNFYLTDYWDADLCAIGIKNSIDGEFLIYISTYQIQQRYFIEVEDSNKEVILNSYKNGELCERNFDELSKIVEKYLHLHPVYEQ